MKQTLVIFCIGLITVLSSNAQSIFEKENIKQLMDKVNAYQLANPWKEYDDNWVRGTYYTGVMACYQATGDKKLLEQCVNWGESYSWSVPTLPAGAIGSGANLLTCTQTWLECYMDKKQKERIKPLLEHLENSSIKNPTSNPTIWYHEAGKRYVDALYVAPPVLAMLYKLTGKEKYAQWMDSFFWDVYGKLYDIEANLFYRDLDFMPNNPPVTTADQSAKRTYPYQTTAAGKKVFWSRGNGWAFAGIARILKYLPQDHANWKKYEVVFKNMSQSLKARQREDGYWPMNLDDQEDFPYKETSGTGFFTYGLAWGINNGILDREEYEPTVRKAWSALVEAVSDEGKVQWGQLGGGAPFVVKQEHSFEYVTGMFLLAASEVYKMD